MSEALFNFTRNYPYDEETQYNVVVSVADNWDEQRRLISAQPRKIFTCNFYPLTKTEVDLIKAFFVARRGSYEQFKFDNPLDLIRYNVRFVDNSLKCSRTAFNTYRVSVMLQSLYTQALISLYAVDYINVVCFAPIYPPPIIKYDSVSIIEFTQLQVV